MFGSGSGVFQVKKKKALNKKLFNVAGVELKRDHEETLIN